MHYSVRKKKAQIEAMYRSWGPRHHFKDTWRRKYNRYKAYLFYQPWKHFLNWVSGGYNEKWIPGFYKKFSMKDFEYVDRFVFPNYLRIFLYHTLYRFLEYMSDQLWRNFAIWSPRGKNGYSTLVSHTCISQFIQDLAYYLYDSHRRGFNCPHCGSRETDQCDLVDSQYFELQGTAAVSTMDGTDYQFWGYVTCPECNTQTEYSDGSL